MPAWQRLTAQTGTADCLREDGHFVAWESPETAARGKRHWLNASTDNAIGTARARPAAAFELAQLRAHFNQRPVDAVRFENTGQILDLERARAAMVQAFQAAGGAVLSTKVLNISIANNVIENCREMGMASLNCGTVHFDDGSSMTPDAIVVAAGVDSANLLPASVGRVPLIAERGYHLDVALTASDLDARPDLSHLPHLPYLPYLPYLPPVAFEDRSVIVTQFARSLRIAGFTEFASRHAPPDARKWDTLSRHAEALGLGQGWGRDLGANAGQLMQPPRWMGARPTLPDYLPAIGQCPGVGNLFYAFGHQHLGLTLAAITGELVSELVCARSPSIDLTPFSLARFQ